MAFHVAASQEPRTFQLEGEFDVAETDAFLSGVGDVTGGDVVLDLRELAFIDSSGVRALLVLADRMDDGSTLILRRATPAVRRVFDLVGLEATHAHVHIDGPET